MTSQPKKRSLRPGRCLTFRAPPAALFDRRLHEAQRQIALALEKNAKRLMEDGKVMKVGSGAKIRILGYYGGSTSSIKPITAQERTAEFVKVEILEGSFKARSGFTTADAVK